MSRWIGSRLTVLWPYKSSWSYLWGPFCGEPMWPTRLKVGSHTAIYSYKAGELESMTKSECPNVKIKPPSLQPNFPLKYYKLQVNVMPAKMLARALITRSHSFADPAEEIILSANKLQPSPIFYHTGSLNIPGT